MSRRFWSVWVVFNLVWLLAAPWAFSEWLANEVRAEYASGARVSTDGDSISIPIAGFIVVNTVAVIIANIGLGAYALFKRRRAT